MPATTDISLDTPIAAAAVESTSSWLVRQAAGWKRILASKLLEALALVSDDVAAVRTALAAARTNGTNTFSGTQTFSTGITISSSFGGVTWSSDGSTIIGGDSTIVYINDKLFIRGNTSIIGVAGNAQIGWAATNSGMSTIDTGLARSAAGTLKVTDGSTGNGTLVCGDILANGDGAGTIGSPSNNRFAISARSFEIGSGAAAIANELRIGTGTAMTRITSGGYIWLGSAMNFGWSTGSPAAASPDIGLERSSAGTLKVTDGLSGLGNLTVNTLNVATLAASSEILFSIGGNALSSIQGSGPVIGSARTYGWSSGAGPSGATPDTTLSRNAAGVVQINASSGLGSLIVAAGTQVAPGISVGTTATGIYQVSTSMLGLAVGSAPALTLTASVLAQGQWGQVNYTYKGPSAGVGTLNRSASNLIIQSGEGTGSGAGGYIAFQTTTAEASGTALQTYIETLRVTPTGVIIGQSATEVKKVLSASATLDFGSIAAGATADLTISVTGAAAGDTVIVNGPAAPDANTILYGFVSAADTVTVRNANISASPIDPASATFRATVLKF